MKIENINSSKSPIESFYCPKHTSSDLRLVSSALTTLSQAADSNSSLSKNCLQPLARIFSYPFVKLWSLVKNLFCCNQIKEVNEFLSSKDISQFVDVSFETFAKAYEKSPQQIVDKIYQFLSENNVEAGANFFLIIDKKSESMVTPIFDLVKERNDTKQDAEFGEKLLQIRVELTIKKKPKTDSNVEEDEPSVF